jgi:hypothetical protein
VLVDLPYEEEVPVEPVALVDTPRVQEPWRRVVAAVAAIVFVAGTVVGGTFGIRSLIDGPPVRTGDAFDGVFVVPDFPSASRPPSPVAKRVPTRLPRHVPAPKATHTVAAKPPAPPTHAAPPPIVVTYRIDKDWGSGFTAEIDVTNNQSTSISGWEIVVALPQDQFTAWWNAVGHANNGILLMGQPPWQGPVAPHGGTLHVYFNVNGTQTTPQGCAFNGITCGLPYSCDPVGCWPTFCDVLNEEDVIVQYTKQEIVRMLRNAGYLDEAEQAVSELPDSVDLAYVQEWAMRHGITRDTLISEMGGSP